ncbi:hypothetical protein HYP71_gp077 [Arthrobacter phage KBurrousTX]|uniref:Uncharacterized protein n=1 Tax=Arthrobacter phage KBurrousTX TaxID=2315608 RepID=A0A386K8D5_9CAUD|nr:hypothetical protein HYP71_gp077 [Arthrobacter phage KBurrousTX]AYD81571.1 hypothetical protein KBurrousTX_77 [Arthrobacter phage KBurrousTX]
MNVRDFDPKPAGEVVPDPFVDGTTNRWMPFDPIKAAMGYHAARAWAYELQTQEEPENTSAAALMLAEYHIAGLYYAHVTGGIRPRGIAGWNRGMRERPHIISYNIRHMLGYLGIDNRDIAPFKSRERIQREALEKLVLDLLHHQDIEGEAVDVRGPHGWYDVVSVIQGALHPDARKGDPSLMPGIREKLANLTDKEPTE